MQFTEKAPISSYSQAVWLAKILKTSYQRQSLQASQYQVERPCLLHGHNWMKAQVALKKDFFKFFSLVF